MTTPTAPALAASLGLTAPLLVVRHGESEKNVRGEHGGVGASLTACGVETVRRLAAQRSGRYTSSSRVLTSGSVQTLETARIFAEAIGARVTVEHELRGISLGQIDGLSDTQIQERFPLVHSRFVAWSRGEIPISKLSLPGGEDFDAFATRVRAALRTAVASGDPTVWVGSRSTLILLWNLARTDDEISQDTYFATDWPPCAGIEFDDSGRFQRIVT